MTYDNEALELYRHMVIERYNIWLSRQNGAPQPWTTDAVLAKLKMTNMFRVLDPGSQFVFELKTDDPRDTIARLVLYRITNLPSTWHAIREALGRYPLADDMGPDVTRALMKYRGLGNRVFSGAYIIMPEPGLEGADKLSGAVNLARRFVDKRAEQFLTVQTQRERYDTLRSVGNLGPFLSMQILADWVYLQDEEPDLSFVIAGPGARRGAKLLNPTLSPEEVIHDLTRQWENHPTVTLKGRSLTPMDVQNTLCEFGKYAREISTPRKVNPYRPAHPGEQPEPVVPVWW